MSMFLMAALAAATAAAPAHKVDIEHGGQTRTVEYQPAVDIRLQQAGIAPPGRTDSRICNWTATVAVERRIDGAAHRVGETRTLSGSQAGACAQQRDRIESQLAGRSGDVQAHVAAVAEQDRQRLTAELELAHGRTGH